MWAGSEIQHHSFGTEHGFRFFLPVSIAFLFRVPVKDFGKVHVEKNIRKIGDQILLSRHLKIIAVQNAHCLLYTSIKLDFATVEAVQAYNHHHNKSECVGYIVTVDGVSVYFAGDTGETEQMSHLEERNLDYAVLPMDFTYTMDVPETIRCANLIAAKHTIPVHMSPGKLFDMDRAKKLTVPGAMIVRPGESIRL